MPQHQPHDEGEDEVEDQRREEQRHRGGGQPVLREVVIDEDAVDADGGEGAGEGTVDDEEADHELIKTVSAGEGQGQRSDDRHGEECTE